MQGLDTQTSPDYGVVRTHTPAIGVHEAKFNEGFPLRAFFGHHKCATGWIDDVLREICLHMGIHFKMVHLPEHFQPFGTIGNLVRQERVDVLAYTNANSKHIADLPLYRGFHVVRDPRDIVVSAYYSHLYSLRAPKWTTLTEIRSELKQMSEAEGLFHEMDFLGQQFQEMHDWDYQQERVLELKMEDLTADPVEGFLNIASFLNILDEAALDKRRAWIRSSILRMNRLNHRGRRLMPANLPMFPVPRRRLHTITDSMLREILDKKSFSKMTGGRRHGQEDVNSHYRKGVSGDWKNHFSDEHRRYFKDNYNDLLIKLGYETSGDW